MFAATVGLFLGADWLAGWFVSAEQEAVAQLAASLLRIVALALVPLGLLQVLTGALRGAGDTRWPLAFTFIGFVGVRLPLAWWLAIHGDWGVRGAWIAMAVDLGVRCLLVVWRFEHGGWKRIEV
jgi:Na+-driven multidrug efflux pump